MYLASANGVEGIVAAAADDAVVEGASACGAGAVRAISTMCGEVDSAKPASLSGRGGEGGALRCRWFGAAIATPHEAEGVMASPDAAGGGG